MRARSRAHATTGRKRSAKSGQRLQGVAVEAAIAWIFGGRVTARRRVSLVAALLVAVVTGREYQNYRNYYDYALSGLGFSVAGVRTCHVSTRLRVPVL